MADPVKAAELHLEPGESVLASVRGRYVTELKRLPGAILATDRRVIVYGSRLVGHKLTTFTYSQLDTISTSKGPLGRKVVLTAGGAALTVDRIKGEVADLHRVVNSQT